MELRSLNVLEVAVATIAVLLSGVFVAWSWITRKTGSEKALRLPPGPRGLPLFGSLFSLEKFLHKPLLRMSKIYGPVMSMRMGVVPTVVVSNAEMIREVLQTNDHLFASRPSLHSTTKIFYDNTDMVFAPYGPHWRNCRKICTVQLLTAARINKFSDLIQAEIKATVQSILQGSKLGNGVNTTQTFLGLLSNIITQMLWGRKYYNVDGTTHASTDSFRKTIKMMASTITTNNLADFLPCKSLIMKVTGFAKKAQKTHDVLDSFLEEIIAEREKFLSTKATTATEASDSDDFLTVLLKLESLPSDDSEKLSRNSMKGLLTNLMDVEMSGWLNFLGILKTLSLTETSLTCEIITNTMIDVKQDMCIAGIDTSSVTLDYALSELMRHPKVMKKAQDELSAVIGSNRFVTPADIPNLKYLKAIVKETLRLHTPAPITPAHYSIADTKVAGYDVPANTIAFANLFAIHHDPNVWDKPMDFIPERFLELDIDYKGQHFNYLPFSSGRRICPGMNLASFVVHLALGQLLHCVNWSLPPGQKPDSVDMTDNAGIVQARANPLFVLGKPRLPQLIT